jgi:hypothetical protein
MPVFREKFRGQRELFKIPISILIKNPKNIESMKWVRTIEKKNMGTQNCSSELTEWLQR